MSKICNNCCPNDRWHPNSIATYENYLSKSFETGNNVLYIKEIKKNIAYNLQYLEFQNQLLLEFRLTDVIITQIYKNFIITGISIVEVILYYLLKSRNMYKIKKWSRIGKNSGYMEISKKKFKVENRIFKKVNKLTYIEMDFGDMTKKAQKEGLIGNNQEIYKRLPYLRRLRNKLHLQIIEKTSDTDWWNFNKKDIDNMKEVLYFILTSELFVPNKNEKLIFDFLVTKPKEY